MQSSATNAQQRGSGERLRTWLTGVLGAVLAFGVAATSASAASGWKPGNSGRWLTDGRGRVVITHGENIVAKVAPWAPSGFGFGEDDANFLAQNGFNTARIGVDWAGVEPRPGVYDDAMLARVRSVVKLLNKRHIGVILDSHQDLYNPRYEGNGFPDWALNDEGLPNPHLGFPDNYFGNSALWRSFENFWSDKVPPGDTVGVQDRFIAMWQHVAAYFSKVRGVFGYEIMNEPFPGAEYTTCANPEGCPLFDEKLSAFYRKVDAAIRSVDATTLVWYEPNVAFDFGANTKVSPLGSGSGFAFHDYCIANESEGGCPTHETTVNNAEKYVASSGDALLMDEWGATNGAKDLREMVALADRHMLPWMEWEYCACNEAGTPFESGQSLVYDENKPPAGANLNSVVFESLVEPYPRVIAGTPRSWGFNRETGTFKLQYTTQLPSGARARGTGAVTEIATPAFNYPSGYAVEVRGGKVKSAPGALALKIKSCPRASEVTVTVAAGITPSQRC
jgi:endoglycosylceramidase